jgi:hypothetical protein
VEAPEHADIISRMKRSIDGELFMIGGFLFRHIANRLHGELMPSLQKAADMDLCTSGTIKPDMLKTLFKSARPHHRFDGVSISENGRAIDVFELNKCVWINDGKPGTIFAYLEDVTFNIQAIAYDLYSGQLLDNGSLNAILRKEIGVQNARRFDSNRQHWGMKGHKKAESMGFKFVDRRN